MQRRGQKKEPEPLDAARAEWFDRVKAGDVAAVETLLARGRHLEEAGPSSSGSGSARAEVRCDRGATALHHAVHAGLLDVARLLLRAGLDANARCTVAGGTPLMWAASQNQQGSVRLLLEEGADAGRPAAPPGSVVGWDTETSGTPMGETALMVAAQYGFPGVCRILVEWGHLHDQNEYGQTALHIAALFGRPEAAAALIDAGAELEYRDSFGATPLLLAAERGQQDAVFTLLWRGADVRAQDLGDATAAQAAEAGGHNHVAGLCKHWRTGALRYWGPELHSYFPACFRRSVQAALLCTVGSGGRGRENPLRVLQDHGILDNVFHQLLLSTMECAPAEHVPEPPALSPTTSVAGDDHDDHGPADSDVSAA